jgi:L-threonylcarbamoyladenylate synthase
MIKTLFLKQDDPQVLGLAVNLLQAGEVIAFPTDTVYGIGARADSENAIGKLYQIKARSMDKPIPVMVAELKQLEQLAESIPDAARRLASWFWPGALTMVLTKRTGLPENLTHLPGVGVRIPDHPFVLELLSRCGPLAVTSANLSGQPEALNAEMVRTQMDGRLALVVDGGTTKGGVPSTVVEFTGDKPRILREGPISSDMINQALGYPG